ncbi:hypothetical protein G9A89_018972 [Geosiphon pyriformis]|nr:hypothetical protein G9A89_018972 [Geosiphon pyriformis]
MALEFDEYVFCEQSILTLAEECEIPVTFRDKILEGYQLYIVEQWVSDRKKPYNTVTISTGVASHKVKAFGIKIDKEKFLPKKIKQLFESLENDKTRPKQLFESLENDKTRPKDKFLGHILVTNLSTFPSYLNLVLVPDGDYESNILDFYINLNLRKVGCSSRSALCLKPPSDAQQAKFFDLYKISTRIPFNDGVLELIKLVQTALYFFGLFPAYYIDGLLCDTTFDALREFHNKYASELELRENPLDTKLDPSLVAALLSMVVCFRNKLHSIGYQVTKDPFSDPEGFLTGVASFQKSAKINAIRSLDYTTIDKIDKVFNRSRALQVHKVLIPTSAVTEIDTDLEVFSKNTNIGRLKYLWRGKGKHPPNENEIDWLHGGKEFGKSILRGVSDRTVKTGEAIRGFTEGVTGSLSSLAQRKHAKEKEKFEAYDSQKESELDSAENLKRPHGSTLIPTEFEITSALLASGDYGVSLEYSGYRLRRTCSFSSYETLKGTDSSPKHSLLKRSNSISALNVFGLENALPRRSWKIDLETYIMYDNLKYQETLLKDHIGELEDASNQYATLIQQASDVYEKRFRKFKSSEQEALLILAKHESIGNAVKKVGTDSAKLTYELDVLEDKLNEIEESVDNFCLKVKILESQIPQPSRPEWWIKASNFSKVLVDIVSF